MATSVLTPNAPNSLTGFANPVLGWQFTAATALDTFIGCNIIFAAGWIAQMGPMPTSTTLPPIWELTISKTVTAAGTRASTVQVLVNDTDYFVFDGQNVWAINEATVAADYTITPKGS